MAILKPGGIALIAHLAHEHRHLNGLPCRLLGYHPRHPEVGEPAWRVAFIGGPQLDDAGQPVTWGWMQERFLMPVEGHEAQAALAQARAKETEPA